MLEENLANLPILGLKIVKQYLSVIFERITENVVIPYVDKALNINALASCMVWAYVAIAI